MAIKTRIEGARELDRVLAQLPRAVGRRVLTGALRAGAKPIVAAAKAKAPVGGGELRDAIVARAVRGERGAIHMRIGPVRAVFHGLFQEFGTKFHRPQPFLRPAFDENAQEALKRIGEALGRAVERAAARIAGPIAKSGLIARRRRR